MNLSERMSKLSMALVFLYSNYSTLHKSTEEDIRDKSSTAEDGINATGESMMIGGSFVGGVAEGVADTPVGMEEVGAGEVYMH